MKTRCRSIKRLTVVFLSLLIVALIYSPPASQAAEEVEYLFIPYLWTAGLDGDLGIGTTAVPVDLSFSDLAEFVDIGGAAVFEARADRWSYMVDAFFIRLAEIREKGPFTVDVEVETTILEVAVAYRYGEPGSFEVLGGARYMDLSTDFDLTPGPDLDSKDDWVDPFLGGRIRIPLGVDWNLQLRGDIGGFGIGSDLTWNALAALGWDVSNTVSLAAAYRVLDTDFDDDGFLYDIAMSGFGLGFVFRF